MDGRALSEGIGVHLSEVRLEDDVYARQLDRRAWIRLLLLGIASQAADQSAAVAVAGANAADQQQRELEQSQPETEVQALAAAAKDQEAGLVQQEVGGVEPDAIIAELGEPFASRDGDAPPEHDGKGRKRKKGGQSPSAAQQRRLSGGGGGGGGSSARPSRYFSPDPKYFREQSPLAHVPNKYWAQRYRYWSRFDEGIVMDAEGWYSVTPEAISRHIAQRSRCNVVVDAFVGCGGNAIQFALASHCVIGIDVDPAKLTAAAANAAAYGVRDRIQLILGDAMRVLPLLRGKLILGDALRVLPLLREKVDVVFLSPPWGGPAYARAAEFDLGRMVPAPLNGVDVLRAARAAADNVIYFLPRNCSVVQVGLLAAEGGERLPCELETQFLNGKLKTKTAYFGHALVHNDYDSDHAEAMEDEAPVSDTQLQAPHSSASDAKHNVHGLAGLQLGAGVGPTPEPSDQQRQPAAACGLEQMGGSAAEGAHSSVDHGGTAEERAEHPSVLRENVLYNQWLDSMHGGAVKRAHVEHNGHKRQ